MMRYRLRTLLILLALLPPVIAWVVTPKLLCKVPLGDGKQVVFKASRFGSSSHGLSGGFQWVEARAGNQSVRVDFTTVTQPGGRKVALPVSWKTVEVTLYGKDFGVVLDGKAKK